MFADNNELVVTVEVDKANQSIKSVNASLSSMEASATKSAKGATQGIDGMTAAMAKGAAAGSLFADAIKSALVWTKDFTVGSVMMAAENAKAEASLKALATAHGVGAAAASKQVAAIEEIGFEFTEAAHAVQRLIVADMDLSKAEGLVREDIGAKFQADLKGMIVNLRGLVGWLKDNTDGLTKFGEIALWVSGILASYALAEKIMALAKSIAALRLASLNPYATTTSRTRRSNSRPASTRCSSRPSASSLPVARRVSRNCASRE